MGILCGGKGCNGSRPCGSEGLPGVHLLSIENNLQVFLPYGSIGHYSSAISSSALSSL